MEGFGQITRKQASWLPREGQRATGLIVIGWIRWRLRLESSLPNRISCREHIAPGLGRWRKLDPDVDGCTAPSVIAC